MLHIDSVYKTYNGEDYAIEDFNIDVDKEEFIVFVGPSGCGKSTTLRMIAGLESITKGDIEIDSKIVNRVHPKDRDIAMVFQNYALYPHMTVYENMAFGLKMRRINKKEIESRILNAARILDIEELLKRKPKALSGGQRQRVALGRAIVRDAKLFLMDEPLSNLDSKLRAQMRAELINLHARLKTTTIYVTHDQTEAMTMATRIVVMDKGRIQQIGTPFEIYRFPENLFVAKFMGTPAMNISEAIFNGSSIVVDDVQKNIELSEHQIKYLIEEGYKNSKIYFGIRPENIEISNNETKNTFTVQIKLVEMTGSETILHFDFLSQKMQLKVDTIKSFKAGENLNIYIPSYHLSFFDMHSEKRLCIEKRGDYIV